MAKNVIIRRRRILTVYHFMNRSFKSNYPLEPKILPRIQFRYVDASMPKISTESFTYFRCISLNLLFLPQLLSRGFGHSNQKHNFGPVKPNSHNK